jgi:dihydrofolate synthase/folylpolyglutamate synthase
MHDLDVKHHNHALQSKLARLYTLRQGSRVHWDRALYLKLLEDLGQDYKKLPPIIHVAGTNGKGSIIAILRAICEAQGMRVHAYTSPHLITVNERIYLAGADISDDYLVQLIDDVMGYVGAMPLSFFEVMTALAFRAFAQVPADILLLEVGCGGRLDCTNVIDAPLATCISRISRDHTEYLGEGVCEIAAEKAGIMKRGVPCVIGRQGDSKSAAKIIEVCCDVAQDVGADALVFGRDWRVDKKDNMLHFNFKGEAEQYPAPNLFGAHQIWNAGAALAVIKSVQDKLKISDAAIATGLTSIYWPGRMQQYIW